MQALNEVSLQEVAVATGVVILAPPVYYIWRLLASFRRESAPHWPPTVCLTLWLLQWPFFILSAAGCLGGGCDDGHRVRDWLLVIGTLAYNLAPAYWLWRRSEAKPVR
jgi:hypothetical protein